MKSMTHSKEQTEWLASQARITVAGKCRNVHELRALGLILGLYEVDPAGSLTPACPWIPDEDRGEACHRAVTTTRV